MTTETSPVLSDSDTHSDDGHAHYADKTEIAQAAVLGGLVTALCSHKFAPIRDPQRFPICPKCKELAGILGVS